MKRPAPTNVLIAGLLLGLWLSSAVPSVAAAAEEAQARRDAAGAPAATKKGELRIPRWETPIPYLPSRKTCDSASSAAVRGRWAARRLQGKYRATVLAGDSPDTYDDMEPSLRVVPQTLERLLLRTARLHRRLTP